MEFPEFRWRITPVLAVITDPGPNVLLEITNSAGAVLHRIDVPDVEALMTGLTQAKAYQKDLRDISGPKFEAMISQYALYFTRERAVGEPATDEALAAVLQFFPLPPWPEWFGLIREAVSALDGKES